jgi:phosphatidylcholine synthase
MATTKNKTPLAAWGVHLFTASGILLALLSLQSVIDGRDRDGLLWLFAAMLVDAVDGTLARRFRVKELLPRIDGDVLDLVIDYLTWVMIPALLIWRSGVLPGQMQFVLVALILLSSLYVFARTDMKTDDGYFRGFPAMWNVIAFYYFVAPPDQVLAALVVAFLVVMTFAPVHVVHPLRVRDYGAWLPVLSATWAAATVALFFLEEGPLRMTVLTVSLASAAILIGMGLLRSLRGPRQQPNEVAPRPL